MSPNAHLTQMRDVESIVTEREEKEDQIRLLPMYRG